jgi:hypothetical protein
MASECRGSCWRSNRGTDSAPDFLEPLWDDLSSRVTRSGPSGSPIRGIAGTGFQAGLSALGGGNLECQGGHPRMEIVDFSLD